ncbi:ABC transporter permease [Wenzhouxiangella marina]|uniref:ABC transporter permease n=1 Tax=Wenzhouxiangella marina TaxID=1579979 RepID=A0A0K0Y063_9GAMM|nr:ABC transporter permease [Wenzhouxiangella marina]AKS43333.1 ABC transporter permease [Wenzhouxiangella marina]MBB6088552.1 sodium transport system permease protein [Wenzhouxiangella marina]
MMAVYIKEMLDNFRDRRVIINTLIIGPLMGPVIFAAMMTFMTRQTTERMEATLELPVIGAEHAPELIRHLERQGVVIKDPPADPAEAIRSEEEEVILRITEDFGHAWREGRPAPVELMVDQSLRYAGTTVSRVRAYLNAYGRQISHLRLQLRGVHPDLTRPIDIRIDDLSTPESRGGMLLAFLPYFILITVFVGSMHMAIDTTAGERERKSLEPLLINPMPRWQIMAGKLAATTTFALLTLGLGLIAFVYAMGMLPVAEMDMALNLDLTVAGLAFVLVAPAALLAASLLTILAAFAKSFREAQSYMGMVIIIPMIPSMWILIDPTRTETWMTLVPLLSQNVLILDLVRGEPVNTLWFALSIGSTGLLALILAGIAGTLYNRPRFIFTSA